MDPDAQIIELLKSLGLTHYEAQVFLELFRNSPQIARTLGEKSKVPRGRIYEVLKNLNNKGLVIEKPSRGSSPNQYDITLFPEGLERLKNMKMQEILREKDQLDTNFNKLLPLMTRLERKSADDVEMREKEEFAIIKGETALDYYIKKLLRNAKRNVLTNFTAQLLLKYKSSFLELQERHVSQTFVLADTELESVKEVIIATNPTVEGEATASYIADYLSATGVKVTRIARGLPVGGDLELADKVTLARSIEGRMNIKGKQNTGDER